MSERIFNVLFLAKLGAMTIKRELEQIGRLREIGR